MVFTDIDDRPILSIRLAIMLTVFIACFIHLEMTTPKKYWWVELMAVLGATLFGIGLSAFIDYFDRYQYICKE